MKDKLFSLLKFAIGWPLSLLAFFFILKIFLDQAPSLLPNLQNINWLLLFFGIVSLLIYYFLRSLIWHRIMQHFSYKVPMRESNYLWAMSELKRYIPGKVWMVLGRTVMFQKLGIGKKDIGKGLLIELEVFVLGSLVVSLLAVPFFFPEDALWSLIWMSICVIIIIGIYCYNQQILSVIARSEAIPSSGGLLRSFFARNDKIKTFIFFLLPPFQSKATLMLVLISIVALVFFGLGNYLVISATFLLDPQLVFQLIGVFVLAFLAGFLSVITPSGLGVREAVMLYGLLYVTTAGLAAFGALFSRLMLILSELTFIGLSYLLRKIKNQYVLHAFRWIGKHPQVSIVAFLSLLYTFYITAASFLRYDNYYTGRFDLGNMVQTVWNTLHGRIFLFTNPDGTEIVSRLAFHADFILILLAPFYALWQDPRMLLLIQTVVVAFGAFFVYAIARDVLKSKNLGVVFAFAYLINPSLERANLYDFHAVTLATTFFLAAFYFVLKKRFWLVVLFLFLAAITKEQVWLIVALFGLWILVGYRKYLLGSALTVIGIGMFYYLISYAIPQASPGTEHFALSYFAAFGDTPAEVLRTILFSPGTVVQAIWTPTRIEYLIQLFLPYGYLSLLFPFTLIFAGPDLGINLLSSNEHLHQIYYQYTAIISPFIIISAIYGVWVLQWLSLRAKRGNLIKKGIASPFPGVAMTNIFVGLYIILTSVYSAYLYGPFPGAKNSNLDMFTKPLKNRAYVDMYLAQIPQDYRVAASNSLGSHLMHRDYIYTVPVGIDRADMIVLLLDNEKSLQTYETVRQNLEYVQVARDGDFVAFERKK